MEEFDQPAQRSPICHKRTLQRLHSECHFFPCAASLAPKCWEQLEHFWQFVSPKVWTEAEWANSSGFRAERSVLTQVWIFYLAAFCSSMEQPVFCGPISSVATWEFGPFFCFKKFDAFFIFFHCTWKIDQAPALNALVPAKLLSFIERMLQNILV